jgi:hypothetical protein
MKKNGMLRIGLLLILTEANAIAYEVKNEGEIVKSGKYQNQNITIADDTVIDILSTAEGKYDDDNKNSSHA